MPSKPVIKRMINTIIKPYVCTKKATKKAVAGINQRRPTINNSLESGSGIQFIVSDQRPGIKQRKSGVTAAKLPAPSPIGKRRFTEKLHSAMRSGGGATKKATSVRMSPWESRSVD